METEVTLEFGSLSASSKNIFRVFSSMVGHIRQ